MREREREYRKSAITLTLKFNVKSYTGFLDTPILLIILDGSMKNLQCNRENCFDCKQSIFSA